MTDKQALKIHGYEFSSDSEDSSNSEGGKSEFDDKYYALRPPPVPFQGLENRIVKIKASGYSPAKNRKKKDIQEGKVTSSNFPIQQNAILERKNIQKSNAMWRRGQAQSSKVLSTNASGSRSGQTQKTVGYTTEQPFRAQTSAWHNRRDFENKESKHTFVEPGNRMQAPPQHLQAKSVYSKEEPFYRTRSTEHTSEWSGVSNTSQQKPANSHHIAIESTSGIKPNQNRPQSATNNPYTNGRTIAAPKDVKEMGRNSAKSVSQVHNFFPFKQEPSRGTNAPMLASHTTNNASTSVGLSSSGAISPTGIISAGTSRTKPANSSTIRGTYAQAARRSSSLVEKSPQAPRIRSSTNTAAPKGIHSNSTNSSLGGTSAVSSNKRESHNDWVYTISSAAPSRNYEATRVVGRRPSAQHSPSVIVSERPPVPPTEILLQRREVVSQQEENGGSGVLYVIRKFFCCKVVEGDPIFNYS